LCIKIRQPIVTTVKLKRFGQQAVDICRQV
jgi:hypothetical protein